MKRTLQSVTTSCGATSLMIIALVKHTEITLQSLLFCTIWGYMILTVAMLAYFEWLDKRREKYRIRKGRECKRE